MNILFDQHILQSSMIGGLFIGLAAVVMFAFLGRITGISGIVFQALQNKWQGEDLWRVFFIAGLIIGPLLAHSLFDLAVPAPSSKGPWLAIIAGLIVGYGTRLGSGCTSGHGICGISRFSLRSVSATMTFMASGFISVFIFNHVL